MPRRRARQHVNPLNFIRDVARPDWASIFDDATRPLEVELGCGKATFLVARAATLPLVNFVGLEIRDVVVDQARRTIASAGVRNVHVLLASANQSFEALFDPGSLARVHVHFPDPWFKTKHRKRRLLTWELVKAIASRLAAGGELHLMTDQEEYALAAAAVIESHPELENPHGRGHAAPGLLTPAVSDREAYHLARGDPVHRWLFVKKKPTSSGRA